MSVHISRRTLIVRGLAAAAGATGLAAAARIADRYGLIPPDHGGIYGAGATLTYAAQRLMMSQHSLAREFRRSDISRTVPVNGPAPDTAAYAQLANEEFAGWRLVVDGLVARPLSVSLADLKALPARSQITHQACEEGWSFIAEWTGVPLADLLARAGVSSRAKYVAFFPFDTMWDSIDIAEAWHPQTLLAYAMNGEPLPYDNGAPLRLRVPRQLGYKSVKYLSRISVVETLDGIGDGRGSASPAIGYSWYAGI